MTVGGINFASHNPTWMSLRIVSSAVEQPSFKEADYDIVTNCNRQHQADYIDIDSEPTLWFRITTHWVKMTSCNTGSNLNIVYREVVGSTHN